MKTKFKNLAITVLRCLLGIIESRYSRKDQVKFVVDSLLKI